MCSPVLQEIPEWFRSATFTCLRLIFILGTVNTVCYAVAGAAADIIASSSHVVTAPAPAHCVAPAEHPPAGAAAAFVDLRPLFNLPTTLAGALAWARGSGLESATASANPVPFLPVDPASEERPAAAAAKGTNASDGAAPALLAAGQCGAFEATLPAHIATECCDRYSAHGAGLATSVQSAAAEFLADPWHLSTYNRFISQVAESFVYSFICEAGDGREAIPSAWDPRQAFRGMVAALAQTWLHVDVGASTALTLDRARRWILTINVNRIPSGVQYFMKCGNPA